MTPRDSQVLLRPTQRSERKRRWDRDNMFRSMRQGGWHSKVTATEIAEMRRRRAAGETVGRIADEMFRNYHTVSRYTKDVRRA